jgi:hypothetical protein
VNTRLLLEWLNEYADMMRDLGRPFSKVDKLHQAYNVILREEEDQA